MHRHIASTTTFVLTGCFLASMVLLGSGCRNTLPEGQVQMQARPTANPDGIEQPPSRLHGAFGLGRSRSADAQNSLAMKQAATNPASTNASGPRTAAQASGVRQASAESSQESSTGASMSFSDINTNRSGAAASQDAPLTREEQQMLIEAFEGASPEIRQLAERRMSNLKTQAAKAPAENALAKSADFAMPDLSPSNSIKQASATTQPDSKNVTSATPTPQPAEPQAGSPVKSSSEQGSTSNSTVSSAPSVAANESTTKASDAELKEGADAPKSSDANSAQSSATTAEETLSTVSDKVLLNELIRREEQRFSEAIGTGESTLAEVIRLRSYRLFADGLEHATKPVEGWTSAEQEFLNHHTLATWNLIDPTAHPIRERRWTTALPEFQQAAKYLGDASGGLLVHNLAFCTAVDGYGQVTPFKADRFTPGQQVIIYSEVDNFGAERLSDGFETHLKGTYRILDATGRRVAEQVLAEDRQTCKNYRRDYFLPYILHLPDRLTTGNYRFELWLEDVKGKKHGTASIPFEIVAATE